MEQDAATKIHCIENSPNFHAVFVTQNKDEAVVAIRKWLHDFAADLKVPDSYYIFLPACK